MWTAVRTWGDGERSGDAGEEGKIEEGRPATCAGPSGYPWLGGRRCHWSFPVTPLAFPVSVT